MDVSVVDIIAVFVRYVNRELVNRKEILIRSEWKPAVGLQYDRLNGGGKDIRDPHLLMTILEA